MAQLEVLPVPPELVPKLWRAARKVGFSRIAGYDIERTHQRLLMGIDQLWVAFNGNHLRGVIVTSISNKPPTDLAGHGNVRKALQRQDKAAMKSLTIHLAGEYELLSWLDSAIERINLYARQHRCRMLFIMARKGWHTFLYRWWSKEWEAVAIGRDRPTASKCKRLRGRNTPGYFRPLNPVPADKWNRCRYAIMETCDFKVESAA